MAANPSVLGLKAEPIRQVINLHHVSNTHFAGSCV
jgi:hypothetical protein